MHYLMSAYFPVWHRNPLLLGDLCNKKKGKDQVLPLTVGLIFSLFTLGWGVISKQIKLGMLASFSTDAYDDIRLQVCVRYP